jgi:SAM-dependent methyltransferase
MSWNPEELEAVTCDFCGEAGTRPVIKRPDGLQAVECVSCGLCYLSPRPKTHLITRLYEAEYFSKSNPDSPTGKIGYPDYLSKEYRRAMLKTNRIRLQVVLPFLPLRGAHCLEVGCATGEFCYLLQRHGAHPLGIDLSTHAIEQAQRRYPALAFQSGDLLSLPPERRFDAIFAFEVIEHVTSPTQFFAKAARQLKPGGLLVLTTPNIDCARQIGWERWAGFLISFEHLFFFAPKSLAAFGQAAGLEPLPWLTDWSDGLVVPPATPKPGLRGALIRALQQTHLLTPALKLRAILQGAPPAGYRPEGTGHNLYMIFRKKAS